MAVRIGMEKERVDALLHAKGVTYPHRVDDATQAETERTTRERLLYTLYL